MTPRLAVVLFAAVLAAGCRLYLWAGSHELTIPPEATPTPEPTATALPVY
jgi:hypothetical protein